MPKEKKDEKKQDPSLIKFGTAKLNAKSFKKLIGISRHDMGLLMLMKRLSRAKKGKDFNCFVQSKSTFKKFIANLKTKMDEFPDHTRFQIAMQGASHHWLLIDCYIENQTLHTLILDAVNAYDMYSVLKTLNNEFPQGKHFCFDGDETSIQNSTDDCQNFVREMAAVTSNIDPVKLFSTLEQKQNTQYGNPKEFNEGNIPVKLRNAITNTRFFTIKGLTNNGMELLSPLFRGIQSLSTATNFPEKVKEYLVSDSKNLTTTAYIELHTFKNSKQAKPRNYLIKFKEQQYSEELIRFKKNIKSADLYHDRSGFGFIVIPELEKIKHTLFTLEKKDMLNILKNIIDYLQTKKLKNSFVDNAIKFLNLLYKSNESLTTRELIQKFLDIVRKLAAQLDKKKSIKNLEILKVFIHDLAHRFESLTEESKEVKESNIRLKRT